ncbi:hypothetical protein QBC35DRAFT_161583 [Podospora australis]|uniref:Uncharacterized protein n=1 Tax=Podospora australis TaxID=1536484 RepID=A0AAN7AN97_9PEZI|nr:hypothetical protein QBC35DRAFT_161583 [Podospora australis]
MPTDRPSTPLSPRPVRFPSRSFSTKLRDLSRLKSRGGGEKEGPEEFRMVHTPDRPSRIITPIEAPSEEECGDKISRWHRAAVTAEQEYFETEDASSGENDMYRENNREDVDDEGRNKTHGPAPRSMWESLGARHGLEASQQQQPQYAHMQYTSNPASSPGHPQATRSNQQLQRDDLNRGHSSDAPTSAPHGLARQNHGRFQSASPDPNRLRERSLSPGVAVGLNSAASPSPGHPKSGMTQEHRTPIPACPSCHKLLDGIKPVRCPRCGRGLTTFKGSHIPPPLLKDRPLHKPARPPPPKTMTRRDDYYGRTLDGFSVPGQKAAKPPDRPPRYPTPPSSSSPAPNRPLPLRPKVPPITGTPETRGRTKTSSPLAQSYFSPTSSTSPSPTRTPLDVQPSPSPPSALQQQQKQQQQQQHTLHNKFHRPHISSQLRDSSSSAESRITPTSSPAPLPVTHIASQLRRPSPSPNRHGQQQKQPQTGSPSPPPAISTGQYLTSRFYQDSAAQTQKGTPPPPSLPAVATVTDSGFGYADWMSPPEGKEREDHSDDQDVFMDIYNQYGPGDTASQNSYSTAKTSQGRK